MGGVCFFLFILLDQLQGGSSSDIIKLQFPTWAYLSTVAFGIVFIYYVDNLAEERCFKQLYFLLIINMTICFFNNIIISKSQIIIHPKNFIIYFMKIMHML